MILHVDKNDNFKLFWIALKAFPEFFFDFLIKAPDRYKAAVTNDGLACGII